MIIIGITGTDGAGKGTVVEYLINKLQFKHYSVRQFLSREVLKQGLEDNRLSLHDVGNDLRQRFGPSYLVESMLDEAIENSYKTGQNAIIESLRVPAEVIHLREKCQMEKQAQFILLSVDADIKIRYERIKSRGHSTDHVTFEHFVEHNKKEAKSKDPSRQNLNTCKKMADFVLTNNGSREDLHKQIDVFIEKFLDSTMPQNLDRIS